MKNLLEQKLELQKQPFFSKGNKTVQDLKDSKAYDAIEIEVQKTWMKYPNWVKTNKSPYEPATKLPLKGTIVLFVKFDKVKDRKAFFGFRLENYRIEEGSFNGMKVVRDNNSDFRKPELSVKVLHKDGYTYYVSPDDVILKPKK